MDQVKVGIEVIKKHHFWVLCVVVVGLGLVFWWSATAGLADRIEERKGALESTQKSVLTITSGGPHPNESSNSAIDARSKELTDRVFRAWNKLYRAQKARNQWPAQLGDEFCKYMDLLGPEDEIPSNLRDTYMYFIRNHFPEMYEIVDIRLPAARDEKGNIKKDENGKPIKIDPFEKTMGSRDYGGAMEAAGPGMYDGAMPGASAMPGMPGVSGTSRTLGSGSGQLIGKVDWSMADLKRIRDAFYWTTQPTSIQVRLAQEDLWVYEALLRIIERTNEGATSHYNAAVKRIEALEIGQRAATAFLRSRVGYSRYGAGSGFPGSGGTGMYGGDGAMPGMPGAGAMPGMPGAGAMPGMPGAGAMPGMPGAGPGPAMPGMPGGGAMPGMPGAGPGSAMPGMPGEGPGPTMPGMPGTMPGSGYGGGMPGTTGGGSKSGSGASGVLSLNEQWKMRLTHGRYVDRDGIPVGAGQPQPFAEFKMMPVRMLLLVDQRRLSSLLVNCANSSMPVEVCQVSLNPGKGKPLDFARMSRGAGPGSQGGAMSAMPGETMTSYPGGMMGDSMVPGSYPSGSTTRGRGQDKQISYDLPVEIQGIIYIFNPPDIEKLGTGSAADKPGAAPGSVPAAPPAPPPMTPPAAAPPTPTPAAPATPPTPTPAATPAAPAAPPAAGATNP